MIRCKPSAVGSLLALAALCVLNGCRGHAGDQGLIEVPAEYPKTGIGLENWAQEAVEVRLHSTTRGHSVDTALTVPSGALREVLPKTAPGKLDLHVVVSFSRSHGAAGTTGATAGSHIADYPINVSADYDTFLLFRPARPSTVTLLQYTTVRGRSPRIRRCTLLGDDLNGIRVVNDRQPTATIRRIVVRCGDKEFSRGVLPPNSCWFRSLPQGPPAQEAQALIAFDDGHTERMNAYGHDHGLLSFHIE